MKSRQTAKARKAAEAAKAKKAAQARKILTVGVGIGLLFVGMGLGVSVRTAFSDNTCGGSVEAMEDYLSESQGGQGDVTVLQTAQEGRVRAVLYEREDLGLCAAVFQRHLLGLRWAYDGMMESAPETGLGLTASWRRGLLGSKCEAVVFGDNRSGGVDAYTVTGTGAGRDGLEADYILDVYLLDGAEDLPRELVQYGPDGDVLPGEA